MGSEKLSDVSKVTQQYQNWGLSVNLTLTIGKKSLAKCSSIGKWVHKVEYVYPEHHLDSQGK